MNAQAWAIIATLFMGVAGGLAGGALSDKVKTAAFIYEARCEMSRAAFDAAYCDKYGLLFKPLAVFKRKP